MGVYVDSEHDVILGGTDCPIFGSKLGSELGPELSSELGSELYSDLGTKLISILGFTLGKFYTWWLSTRAGSFSGCVLGSLHLALILALSTRLTNRTTS